MDRKALAEWRARRTEELVLPSGLTVTVRRISLLDLISLGRVPMPLLGMVEQAAANGTGKLEIAQLPEYMSLVNAMVRQAVVDPPIADTGDDDHLGIDELPADDRLAIFNWLNGPAREMAPFRAEPAGAVASA